MARGGMGQVRRESLEGYEQAREDMLNEKRWLRWKGNGYDVRSNLSCFSSFKNLHSPAGQTEDFFPGMNLTLMCMDTVQHC